MNIEEFVNKYLKEHRHEVLLNPYNGVVDFAKAFQEKLMEDAMEGVIEEVSFNNGEQHNTIRFSFDEESLHVENRIWFPRCGKDGDKVRMIIIKEN